MEKGNLVEILSDGWWKSRMGEIFDITYFFEGKPFYWVFVANREMGFFEEQLKAVANEGFKKPFDWLQCFQQI